MTLDFKYVPTLRFREEERKALQVTPISNKIIPLIEIMSEKPRVNGKVDCIDAFINDYRNFDGHIMFDFPMYLKIQNKTKSETAQFITKLKANPSLRINKYLDNRLKVLDKIIPVITYDPLIPYKNGNMTMEEKQLRGRYPFLAFRIFQDNFLSAFQEILNIIKKDDVLILDIDETHYANINLKLVYTKIRDSKLDSTIKKVLLRSAIPRTLTNTGLTNNHIINEADNGLFTNYLNLGFDAFGDYVGVKKDEITDGGSISPGYIMYSWKQNAYFGFNGIYQQAKTFETMIVPSILSSTVWGEYSVKHKSHCYGCCTINNINSGIKKGKSQKEWKGFAIGHYLHTMEEFL